MDKKMENKKITLRDRKKAQPKAVVFFSEAEKKTIQETVASNLNQPQFNVFMYTSQALGLNPLLSEICAVTYKGIMSIQVMRDGFLTIAHRSGKFAGLESGVNVDKDGKIVSGWAKVYHKDFQVPVFQEADFEEYDAKRNLWLTKPKTMIKKVAESMALRKAFNVSGVYAPEEMDKEIMNGKEKEPLALVDGDKPPTTAQLETIKTMSKAKKMKVETPKTKQEAVDLIIKLSKETK